MRVAAATEPESAETSAAVPDSKPAEEMIASSLEALAKSKDAASLAECAGEAAARGVWPTAYQRPNALVGETKSLPGPGEGELTVPPELRHRPHDRREQVAPGCHSLSLKVQLVEPRRHGSV